MPEITLDFLKKLWTKERESYKSVEVGSGVQMFVKKCLQCPVLFNLKEGKLATDDLRRKNEYIEEARKKGRRADVVIFIDSDIIIPIEVERFGNIEAGCQQLFNYQADWVKKYGILTDGSEWRFYNNTLIEQVFRIDDILKNPTDFLTFWAEYITPEYYYQSFFEKKGQQELFAEFIPNVDQVREDFFKDITRLIDNFKNKLNLKGYFRDVKDDNERDKKAVEITYAYLIQFILYKTLVDNTFADFADDWLNRVQSVNKALKAESYAEILVRIRDISHKISENIYKRFSDEQEIINKRLDEILSKPKNVIGEVSVWLDILLFINRYDFRNVKNEIFGYVYENYLKDLYLNEKKGQYFTDPHVVDFMLDQIGYTPEELKKRYERDKESISIIDPSCGSGTFLYNATNRIVEAFFTGSDSSAKLAEELINENVFGLDIAEFPLYLAEMNILMRMLPLVINEKYNNPIEQKIKVFKTRDSISEFLDTAIRNTVTDISVDYKKNQGQGNLFTKELELGYDSYVRDKRDLNDLKNSLEERNKIPRFRFDYVIGNPPYVSYNECSKQGLLAFQLIKERRLKLNDIYGVNLHSVDGHRKVNRPNPNLYLFFMSLGLALLKDNGKISYIIPQTLLTAGDFDVMRHYLANYVTIEKIVTFTNAMFVGRGIKQKNKIATSSLIFVISKKLPTIDHSIEIIRHQEIHQEVDKSIKDLRSNKKITKTRLLQQNLKKSFVNWNFILFEEKYLQLYDDYRRINNAIDIYYEHSIAEKIFDSRFYFDGGYSIDESIRLNDHPSGDYYIYPKFDNNYYSKIHFAGYWPNIREGNSKHKIELRQANQEYCLLDSSYKIVWSYINPTKFYLTRQPIIWARNQYNAIGSDNKNELLYLFAILNSRLNWIILVKNVKSENEKDVLFSLKAIKNFICVPIITSNNEEIKREIISQADNLIALEKYSLSDYIDFREVLQQRFDRVDFHDNIMHIYYRESCFSVEIQGDADLLKRRVQEKLPELIIKSGSGSINELKNLPIIDVEKQKLIKYYIDDLVFSLYFKVPLEEIGFDQRDKVKDAVKKHKYYDIVKQAENV